MSHRNELAKQIMVALDYPSAEHAEQLIVQLTGIPCTLKVGMQLFYAAGPAFVIRLKERGYHVFLDLKLHDIPNTVRGAAQSITKLGVDVFNVHAAGGLHMMQAAMEGVEEALGQRSDHTSPTWRPVVIGVTQLTSTDQKVMNEEIGIPGPLEKSVVHYASLCKQAGLQGVVASALEVPMIKHACGTSFLTVTPGIRGEGDATGDQHRVITPQQAFALGTDYIVIGRPITQANDPRAKIESILDCLKS